MAWQHFPVEIRFHILSEVVHLDDTEWWEISDCTNDDGETWAHIIMGYMTVCSKITQHMSKDTNSLLILEEWRSILRSCLASECTDTALNFFPEQIGLELLEANIPRLKRDASKILSSHRFVDPEHDFITQVMAHWLCSSVSARRMSHIQLLLHEGADINVEANTYEQNALQVAMSDLDLHFDIAELLAKSGGDIDMEDCNGENIGFALLCRAAEENNIAFAKWLVEKGVELQQSSQDDNPLSYALGNNNVELAEFLLDKGASFFNNDTPRILPLAEAAHDCTVETISMLIDRGADVTAVSEDGDDALEGAIHAGNEPVALFLVTKGAAIERRHIQAAARLNPPILEKLLDITGPGSVNTALETASSVNNRELVRHLLNRGAKPKYLDLKAVSNNNIELVRMLLDAGADPNTPSDLSGNSLYRAAMIGSVELVELLLDRGVPVNFRTGRCQRALQIAAANGHTQVVRILLERGADVHHVGGDYTTALYAAINGGWEEIQKLLLEYGHPRVEN